MICKIISFTDNITSGLTKVDPDVFFIGISGNHENEARFRNANVVDSGDGVVRHDNFRFFAKPFDLFNLIDSLNEQFGDNIHINIVVIDDKEKCSDVIRTCLADDYPNIRTANGIVNLKNILSEGFIPDAIICDYNMTKSYIPGSVDGDIILSLIRTGKL